MKKNAYELVKLTLIITLRHKMGSECSKKKKTN